MTICKVRQYIKILLILIYLWKYFEYYNTFLLCLWNRLKTRFRYEIKKLVDDIINKFLLESETFMQQTHFRLRKFTYRAGRSLTKSKEQLQKSKITTDSR